MPAKTENAMNDESSCGGQNTNGVKGVSQAVEISLQPGPAGRKDNLDGTKGTPPTIRVPNNCIYEHIQPLRFGIDSLYLSYPGNLSESIDAELHDLKKQAQNHIRKDLSAKAQIRLGDHVFEVMDKGMGRAPYVLVDNSFHIQLASHKAISIPMAYVQISSEYLCHVEPLEAEKHLQGILCQLGEIDSPNVSRIDLFVDFASNENMEGWHRTAWVTTANHTAQHADRADFTGWSIGAGGPIMARLYDKRKESIKSKKTYLEPLCRENGWDGEMPVWRLEFQFRSEVLKQCGLSGLRTILENLNSLWQYGTTDWLKLTKPNESDNTRSRWPIRPIWQELSSIDWKTSGGPLKRIYSHSRAPSEDFIGKVGLRSLASMAALHGIYNFDAACVGLLDLIYGTLDQEAVYVGVMPAELFQEKVEILQRKYNTRLNPPLPDVIDTKCTKDYRRQTQGY